MLAFCIKFQIICRVISIEEWVFYISYGPCGYIDASACFGANVVVLGGHSVTVCVIARTNLLRFHAWFHAICFFQRNSPGFALFSITTDYEFSVLHCDRFVRLSIVGNSRSDANVENRSGTHLWNRLASAYHLDGKPKWKLCASISTFWILWTQHN